MKTNNIHGMKILQLCNKPPYPASDGGMLAMHRITEGLLQRGHEVKVLAVETDKHQAQTDAMGTEYRERTRFESVYVDLSVKPVDAGVALLCGDSYNVKRYESRDFERRLTEILDSEEFDIVQMESLFLTPYVPAVRHHSNAKIVLRAHNVEHLIWRQNAMQERSWSKRWYMKKLALALRMYELEHLNDYDAVACISPIDMQFFKDNGCRKPMAAIPFSVEVGPQVSRSVSHVDQIYHLASMDWMPNIDSVDWLLDKVWPNIAQRTPQARLFLAGRGMPQRLIDRASDQVTIEGEVPDAALYATSKQINIVPLRSGSGIRVKILEAMAMGKTVIATTVGAAGIEYADGKNIIIADTPEQIALAVEHCLADPAWCYTIGDNARQLIEQRYTPDVLMQRLETLYDRICSRTEE